LYNEAIDDFRRALDLDANNKLAANYRGLCHQMQAQYKLAIEDYTRALEIDSKYAIAYFNRGVS
jgi:tetratricopeptide (TPR) repeat protein